MGVMIFLGGIGAGLVLAAIVSGAYDMYIEWKRDKSKRKTESYTDPNHYGRKEGKQ